MARTRAPRAKARKTVETLTHEEATRKNLPTAEVESVMREDEQSPIRLAYERRNRDLDPQLVWRGKDEQDWSDLVVQAPPLYIQEKVHPKVLIDDLLRRSQEDKKTNEPQLDMFADFNGLSDDARSAEFYQHDANWTNRMILGDSLQVMASLAEREGLRGKVQCIYIDPTYGIKFNSNFQWSTTSRVVRDGNVEHITREPEQVKAFRDTWRDGIHSYLTYLRDRLTVARDLITETGSVFVQIGDENVHHVRELLDEVFGTDNFCAAIAAKKTGGQSSVLIPRSRPVKWCKSASSCCCCLGGCRLREIGLRKSFVAGQNGGCEVSTSDDPFVVLLSQDGANEAAHGRPVREDAHHIGASPDLLVETLLWVVGPELLPVGEWEAGEGQDVGSRFVQ